ncbi:MAG: ADP-forming succinate--CoA ligase subunit beta [Anaerolineae bacterium]
MNLYEYQAKKIFTSYGIAVPPGEVATTPGEARAIARRLGGRVAIKAQVLVGGRGKAGGIKLASGPQEAEEKAAQILGMDIKGLTVKKVLVEPAVNIAQELYLGAVLDREARRVTVMASPEGGVDIEEVARTTPDRIFKASIDPFLGLRDYQARQLAHDVGLEGSLVRDFTGIARHLYRCFVGSDASLAEINPLVVSDEGRLLALDAKMVLDDNSLFRHPDLAELRDVDGEDAYEWEAREHGLSYVKLDGEIGCMVNGAGLAMATMDLTKLYGGAPANFLDIGGGARADRVAAALRIILSDPNVKVVLFNIFGGITRCDEVARGILTALAEIETEVPMVARLVGTNEEEGRRLLAEAQMITATTLEEAAQKAVELSTD